MDTTSVQGSNFLASLALPQENKNKNKDLGQEEFFKILTTQLQSQDPLNPEGGADFIAQMAQFSSLEGINKLNDTMSSLSSNILSSQALQVSSLIGKSIQVSSTFGSLNAKDGLAGSVNLTEPVTDLTVSITDSAGSVVKKLYLGNRNSGLVDFKWDGITDNGMKAQDGNYFIKAEGMSATGQKAYTTNATFPVEGVELNGAAGAIINLPVGSVSFSDVVRVI
ncbi:MAG: hypothetical protein KIT27_03390 [Legionellales bacterium]|nr:hypothetical protein [Legionellales bacterium]